MDAPKRNILFICKDNSALSIMAETLINNLPVSKFKFKGYSAGSHLFGHTNPLALEILEEYGLSTAGVFSKSWDEFTKPDALTMQFVITVCGQAFCEQHPTWPGQPVTAFWCAHDPVAVDGEDEDEKKRNAFKDAFLVLRRRIELFAYLPLAKPDALGLRKRTADICQQ